MNINDITTAQRASILRRVAVVAAVVAMPWVAHADHVGTAFSYQGELLDGGAAVNDTCDFEFTLWDTDSGGAQVGSTLTPTITVADGRFTTTLDFGTNVFPGAPRYLEIGVCCSTGCAPGYTLLTPRQELTPAPYALALPALRTTMGPSGPNVIGGDHSNTIDASVSWATISGGSENTASDSASTVSGGSNNMASGSSSTISGGFDNTASGNASTIGGGSNNTGSGTWSTVGGGRQNTASALHSAVSGGWNNTANGARSIVGGGDSNRASGSESTVPGGDSNQAGGNYSFAAGRRAKVRDADDSADADGDEGTFVWADSTNANFTSTGPDQFLIRANGGVGIGTDAPVTALEVVGTVTATTFAGDGSALTNLPSSSMWMENGSDIHYPIGNVGVGTNTPATELDVAGTVTATAFAGDGSALTNLPVSSVWNESGSDLHYNGEVGIGAQFGSQPPAGLLHLRRDSNPWLTLENTGNVSSSGRSVAIQFNHSNGNGARIEARREQDDSDGMFMRFYTEAIGGDVTERMRITPDGNVGIGTMTPTRFMEIRGDAQSWPLAITGPNNAGIRMETDGTASSWAVYHRTSDDEFVIRDTTDGADRLTISGTNGSVDIPGSLSKGGGSFKIDHPLDPENKYLYHSFVESPDMMNVYNGNVVTDHAGYATVTLPDYFEALNREFRYQLTIIDGTNNDEFAMAKVVQRITGNEFTIRTSVPSTEVSWQVTGVRQDPWAEANRIPNVVEKRLEDKGLYLHPEAWGQPAQKGFFSKDSAAEFENHQNDVRAGLEEPSTAPASGVATRG
jgi:hypothetical protein